MTDMEEILEKRMQALKDTVLTPERQSKDDITLSISPERGGYEFRSAQTPMDYYINRKIITGAEYRAGQRLYKDFYVSGQTTAMVVDLNAVRAGDRRCYMPVTEMQREALDSWRKAIDSVSGKIGQLMVLNVCCYGYWLKDISYLPYKSDQTMPRFKEALEDLVKYYEENKRLTEKNS